MLKEKFKILDEIDDLNITVMPGDSIVLLLDNEEILKRGVDKVRKIDRAVNVLGAVETVFTAFGGSFQLFA